MERALFFLLIFSIPFQTRVFLWSANAVGGFNEWQSVFLYATDLLVGALFLLWLLSGGVASGVLSKPRSGPPTAFSGAPPTAVVGQVLRLLRRTPEATHASGQSEAVKYFPRPIHGRGAWWGTLILLAVFLVIGFVSIFFTLHWGIGVYRWVKLVEFAGLFFYVGYIMRRVRFSHVAFVLIASGLVQSFIAIGQFSLQRSLSLKFLGESPLVVNNPAVAHIVTAGGTYIRAYGTLPSPNVLAAFLSIAILFLIYLYVASESWHRRANGSEVERESPPAFLFDIFAFAALVSLIFALFLTFSRGVLLAFFVSSALFFVLLLFSQKRRAALRVLLFFIMAHVIVVGLMWPELFSRFIVSNPTNDAAVTERFFFNEVAYQAIITQPWLGVGLGNFTFFYRDFFSGLSEHLYQPVHNIFLLVGAEMGVVALVFFIVFFAKMLGARIAYFLARGSKQGEHALFVAVLTFVLLSGFIDHYYLTIQQGGLIFWLVLGLSYFYISKNEISSRDKP